MKLEYLVAFTFTFCVVSLVVYPTWAAFVGVALSFAIKAAWHWQRGKTSDKERDK